MKQMCKKFIVFCEQSATSQASTSLGGFGGEACSLDWGVRESFQEEKRLSLNTIE